MSLVRCTPLRRVYIVGYLFAVDTVWFALDGEGDQRAQGKGLSFAIQGNCMVCKIHFHIFILINWMLCMMHI